MRTTLRLLISLAMLSLPIANTPPALAQGQIAVEKKISLSRGKTRTLRGRADSFTSYVYKFRAEKGRSLQARVTSEGGTATFSIVPPGTQILANAAAVKEWQGTLPEQGVYSVVVAMNTTGDAMTPYTLELTLQ
jgi:predicted secreted protein